MKDRSRQTLVDTPDDFVSPEVARLVNYRMRSLLGTKTWKRLNTFYLNKPLTAEKRTEVLALLNARWNALVVEYKTLEKISTELMKHGIAITGFTLREDPDTAGTVIVVPIVAKVR